MSDGDDASVPGIPAEVRQNLDEILPARGALEFATEWIDHYDPTWSPDFEIKCKTPAEPTEFVDRQVRLYTEFEGSVQYEALVFAYELESADAAAAYYDVLAAVLETCDSSRESIAENLREVIDGPVQSASLLAVPEAAPGSQEQPTAIFVLQSGPFVVVIDDWLTRSPVGTVIQGELAQRTQENLLAAAEGTPISEDAPFAPRDRRSDLVEVLLAGASTRYVSPSAWLPNTRPASVFDACGQSSSPLLSNEFVATASDGEFFSDLANANIISYLTVLEPGADPAEFAMAMQSWEECFRSRTDWEPPKSETLTVEGHGEVELLTTSGHHPSLGTSHIRSVVDGPAVLTITSDINADEAGRDLTPEIVKRIGAFLDHDWS